MAFNREEAKKAGYTDQEIDAYLAKQGGATSPQARPSSTPIIDALGKTGVGSKAFDFPILGGVLRGAGNAGESFGRMVGGASFEAARAFPLVPVNKEKLATVDNPFLAQGDPLLNADTAGVEALGRTTNAMLNVASVKGIPAGVKAVTKFAAKDILPFLKNPTSKGAQALQQAGADTISPDYQAAAQVAKEAAKDAPIPTQSVLQKLITRFDPNAPATGGDLRPPATNPFTGRQALNLRQTLDKYVPSKAWSQNNFTTDQIDAAKFLRRALDQQLKQSSKLKEADKVISAYSKGGPLKGDIPTKLMKLLLGGATGYGVAKLGGGVLGKGASQIVNTVAP